MEEEIDITVQLAGPMTMGGPFIFLLEPLDSHPWADGIEKVIKVCASLRCLQETVYACSKDKLRLMTGISLLNLWPFLLRRSYADLTLEQKVDVQNLVLDAVCQKRPDILLIMCKG